MTLTKPPSTLAEYWNKVAPSSAFADGTERVTVTGGAFDVDAIASYTLRISGLASAVLSDPPIGVTTSRLTFNVPPWPFQATIATLEVLRDGTPLPRAGPGVVGVSTRGAFEYLPTWAGLTPTAGPAGSSDREGSEVAGGTIAVTAYGLSSEQTVRCCFRGNVTKLVEARLVTTEATNCVTATGVSSQLMCGAAQWEGVATTTQFSLEVLPQFGDWQVVTFSGGAGSVAPTFTFQPSIDLSATAAAWSTLRVTAAGHSELPIAVAGLEPMRADCECVYQGYSNLTALKERCGDLVESGCDAGLMVQLSEAANVSSTTAASCPFPHWSYEAQQVTVQLRCAGQAVLSTDGIDAFMPLDVQPYWDSASPTRGLASGGDRVFITGGGLSALAEYTCGFEEGSQQLSATAWYLNTTAVECVSPQWFAESATVALLLESKKQGAVDFLGAAAPGKSRHKGSCTCPSLPTLNCRCVWVSLSLPPPLCLARVLLCTHCVPPDRGRHRSYDRRRYHSCHWCRVQQLARLRLCPEQQEGICRHVPCWHW